VDGDGDRDGEEDAGSGAGADGAGADEVSVFFSFLFARNFSFAFLLTSGCLISRQSESIFECTFFLMPALGSTMVGPFLVMVIIGVRC